jgi:uncharacterized membrane protein
MKINTVFNPIEFVGLVLIFAGVLWSFVKREAVAGMHVGELGICLIFLGALCSPFFRKK